MKHRGSFPHRMDAPDRHNGQRDERTNGRSFLVVFWWRTWFEERNSVADLVGGRWAPLLSPALGRRTDAVTHGTPDMWQRYCMMATPSPAYLFKHVKHGTTRNIQNDCHQSLCDSFRANQIRFRPGLHPDPAGGAYSAPRAPI